jgi:hypothetical protein
MLAMELAIASIAVYGPSYGGNIGYGSSGSGYNAGYGSRYSSAYSPRYSFSHNVMKPDGNSSISCYYLAKY